MPSDFYQVSSSRTRRMPDKQAILQTTALSAPYVQGLSPDGNHGCRVSRRTESRRLKAEVVASPSRSMHQCVFLVGIVQFVKRSPISSRTTSSWKYNWCEYGQL